MRRTLAAWAAGVLLLSLTACATGGPMSDPTSSASPGRIPFETTTPGPIGSSGAPTEASPEQWDAIVADLSRRGVTGEPELVSAEAVTWPNGALGCPKPGMSYTQAMVDGTRVVVTVDGTTYDYRFGRGDAPVLCEA
ncbi:hypothetical protein [Microbacterium sp. CFBP9034]|uniref:hypothetical protein n=1 Tax=Microbacterium sp. CFBP9034 TaxID=3096540 RepID=UPI002A6AA958|nr:hypothetical protein [Microbacterium sp. CFBP9034]MDY0910484.1 hypothetical protein [Microbacterium sp. CFBP9034]